MNSKRVLSAVMILGLVGGQASPGLANSGHGSTGSAHGDASDHHACEEMLRHGVRHGHVADHLRHLLKHHQDIGLTEEQIKQLKAIELEYDRAAIKTEAEIYLAEREVRALLEDENTELSTLETKVKQSELLEVGLRMAAFKARRDALAVLMPEQREKAKAAHEKRMPEIRGGT